MTCGLREYIATNCGDFQEELSMLVTLLAPYEQIKVGSGNHEPTWVELSDLWGGCAAPEGAMVFWHNTLTDIVSWWVSPTGDSYEALG